MNEFRTRLGENGRFVIPAPCRKLLQFTPGEELVIRVEDGELHVLSLKQAIHKVQALVKKYAKNQSLVEELFKLRKEDKKHEK